MAEQLAGLNKEYSNPLKWTYLDSKTGTTAINLPTDYTELYVEVSVSSAKYTGFITNFTTGNDVILNGYYMVNPYGAAINVTKTATTINLKQVYVAGSDQVANATVTVYYR